MKFNDAKSISTVVQTMIDANTKRSTNRALIDTLFNGAPPYSDEEAEKHNIFTNVNFLEGAQKAHDARKQFFNGFLAAKEFVNVRVTVGPAFLRDKWSTIINKHLNRIMKRSLAYVETLRQSHAQIVLHGIGPVTWPDRHKWCPETVALDDLMIPSETLTSLSNLTHFAIRRRYTPEELNRKVSSEQVDSGWNIPLAKELIATAVREKTKDFGAETTPEQIAERIRSNSGFYGSDAVATIDVWDFFYLNDNAQWERRIVPDFTGQNKTPAFLFNPGKRVYANSISEILHLQIADGNNVAPFKLHSVRSLGFLLYAVLHMQNRVRCRFMDAVFESANWYFYVTDAADRDNLRKVELHNYGVIPNGVRWVLPQERQTTNGELFLSALSQNRQLISETSSSYTADTNDGTQKELTATEVMARVNAANAMVGGMLAMAYVYHTFQLLEICRRFTNPNSIDPDVKKFQTACVNEGVPPEAINSDLWDVDPVRAVGAGNKTIQLYSAQQLMNIRPLLPPDSQREVLRMFIAVNTDDPDLADRLVPTQGRDASNTVHEAQLAMGTLMLGLPVALRSNLNPVEYAATLLALFATLIQQREQDGATASKEQLIGFLNVEQHLWGLIDLIAQDDQAKPLVKQLSDELGKLMNFVKGYLQRYQEQMQAQGNGLPPEVIAKIEASRILAESQARIKEAATNQKLHHKELAFQADQRRKDQAAKAQIAAQDIQTQHAIVRDQAKADSQTPAKS